MHTKYIAPLAALVVMLGILCSLLSDNDELEGATDETGLLQIFQSVQLDEAIQPIRARDEEMRETHHQFAFGHCELLLPLLAERSEEMMIDLGTTCRSTFMRLECEAAEETLGALPWTAAAVHDACRQLGTPAQWQTAVNPLLLLARRRSAHEEGVAMRQSLDAGLQAKAHLDSKGGRKTRIANEELGVWPWHSRRRRRRRRKKLVWSPPIVNGSWANTTSEPVAYEDGPEAAAATHVPSSTTEASTSTKGSTTIEAPATTSAATTTESATTSATEESASTSGSTTAGEASSTSAATTTESATTSGTATTEESASTSGSTTTEAATTAAPTTTESAATTTAAPTTIAS